ncbi:MAG: hypothetical protein MUO34_06780, partial [Ignavibacteriaceae bacterium]|nr:hypothetical protein [Ignavibacteriaceae bacterium]
LTFIKLEGKFGFNSLLRSSGTVIVYFVFAYATYLFTSSTIKYLLEDVKIGIFLLHRFIFVVLFIFFMAVNIGNIVVSYSTLYRTTEVGFLMTKPVSFVKLFLIKFFDNFFYSSSTLLLVITAVVFGYAEYFKLPWYFIPFSITFLILPFMFIAGSLGAIVLLLILRFAARIGIKKVLGLLFGIYGTATISFYYFSSPVELVNKVFEYFPNLNNYFGFLEDPAIRFLPNYWISEALYWIVSGNFTAALWYVYLMDVISILIFILALFLAKIWYYKTWLVSLDLPTNLVMKRKSRNKIFSFENDTSLTPPREAVLKREFLMFFREPSQWTHLLVMLFLITVFISSLGSVDVIIMNAYNTQIKTLVYLIVYLFNVFLIASLSLRFVFPLVSLEGETIWKIRSSPLNYKKLLITRLVIYFSIIFLIGQLLNFFSNYRFSIQLVVISQINTFFVTVTLVALNFGMGAIFANYKERNPIRIASSQGASLTFLFTIIYLVFLIILLFFPISNYFDAIQTGRMISITELLYTTLILGSLASIISYLSVSTGIKYFSNDV